MRKDKLVNININYYRNAKKVFNEINKNRKNFSAYQQRKIKALQESFKANQTRKEKQEAVNKLQKFLGFKKDGTLGSRKKPIKLSFNKQGDKFALIKITPKKSTSYLNTKKGKYQFYRSINDMLADENFLERLNEWNLPAYLSDFASGLYTGWIERYKREFGLERYSNQDVIDWTKIIIKRTF